MAAMTSKQRLQTAWSFQEPDRVPIELKIGNEAQEDPRAERLVQLIEEHADNFSGGPAYDWGFLGWPAEYAERVLEHCPGEFIRRERVYETPVGPFTAIVREPDTDESAPDCHWEKRFITSPQDIERLLEAPLRIGPPKWAAFEGAVAKVGNRGLVTTGILHPLGRLVRNATMEEVYIWFIEHRGLMHRFLEVTNDHVARVVSELMRGGIGPYFSVTAHEMLIPPWAGMKFFDEFVFPYDKQVNDVVHRNGGKLRIHCHGNAMNYLERFAEMGVDAIEPLEAPPMGDVDLAEAKRRVGDRTLLSGNIASPYFPLWSRQEVEEAVREAIRVAAPGGGFTLRTTGGTAGTNAFRSREQLGKIIENCEAYILAGLEYGAYPIST